MPYELPSHDLREKAHDAASRLDRFERAINELFDHHAELIAQIERQDTEIAQLRAAVFGQQPEETDEDHAFWQLMRQSSGREDRDVS